MKKLRIDTELASLLEKHSPEEMEQLEENLMNDGCRDAIVVWRGTDIIVEGMTRYTLCIQHEIPFKIVRLKFKNRAEVVEFILNNQLGRRNISPESKHKLRDARIKRVAEATVNGQSTRQIAKKEGVSPTQIQKDLEKATREVANAKGGATINVFSGENVKLLPELLALNPSPKIIPKLQELPLGKQKDMVPLVKMHGISKAYQMVTDQREPGVEEKPKKVGSVVFNWKAWDAVFSPVARGPDDVARAYGGREKESNEHDECIHYLSEFRRVWTMWRKRLTTSSV